MSHTNTEKHLPSITDLIQRAEFYRAATIERDVDRVQFERDFRPMPPTRISGDMDYLLIASVIASQKRRDSEREQRRKPRTKRARSRRGRSGSDRDPPVCGSLLTDDRRG